MNGVFDLLRNLGAGRLFVMAGVAVAMILFFLFLTVRVTSSELTLLYGNLSTEDSRLIANKLSTMNISYEVRDGGASIFAPGGEIARLRLAMAEEGLPLGGSVGYEIFDQTDSLGTTSFVQQINHLRALEGELARTIRSIEAIAAVRVHLVMPNRELFARQERPPSASIVLRMRRGRLDRDQVAAIQHLVASAVPNLKPNMISIVDERGILLARGSGDDETRTSETLEQQRSNFENRVRSELEALVGSVVGFENVRVEISADVDYDRITTTSEIYDPEGQVVRSSQTVEEQAASSEPVPSDVVSVGANLPEAAAEDTAGNASTNNTRVEETVNYEITKTVKTELHEAGRVNRYSVAVLVNGSYEANAQGERVYVPRSEEELRKIEALAKSAIGYDESRGDKVEVVNLRFSLAPPVEEVEEEQSFLGLKKRDYFRIAEIAVLGVVAILVIFLVLRPLVIKLLATPLPRLRGPEEGSQRQIASGEGSQALPGAQAAAQLENAAAGRLALAGPDGEGAASDSEGSFLAEGRTAQSHLRKVGDFVSDHPEEAVSVMRTWMYQDA